MEPQHSPRRSREKSRRWLLAVLPGAACALFLLGLFPHLVPPANAQGRPDATPSSSSSAPVSSVAEATAAPGIFVEREPSPTPSPTPAETPWYLRLVNQDHPLPRDFTVELADIPGGRFDARAAEALSQMLSAMEAQGLSPVVCSSFRTWEDQETLHQNKIDRLLGEGYSPEEAATEASRWVVPAGASEHQLGLAVDLVSAGYQMLVEEQENTPEQQWLMENCATYGFILRYPKDKTDITGVGYEPWHYRYVGREAAQAIWEQGICLEEYEDMQ